MSPRNFTEVKRLETQLAVMPVQTAGLEKRVTEQDLRRPTGGRS